MRGNDIGRAAVVALAATLAISACSSQSGSPGEAREGERGQVGLNLQPVAGVSLGVVSYRVTQGAAGSVVKTGNLPVPGSGKSFGFGVPLPVGSGYLLSLEAVSVDGKVTCAGSAGPFSIAANSGVELTPTLTCTDVSTGEVRQHTDLETNACPDVSIDFVSASPRLGQIGDSITLHGSALSASGKALGYSWAISNPSVGVFTLPLTKDTSLVCTGSGDSVRVTLTASNGECEQQLDTRVSCLHGECGDGIVEPGETCDTALQLDCPADCTQVCGDGFVEGTEACEPPNTPTCNSQCLSGGGCGDGFLSAAEACDWSVTPSGAPPGTTCSQACVPEPIIDDLFCGDGIVSLGEKCDGGGGGNYALDDCGGVWGPNNAPANGGRLDACRRITSSACLVCEETSECVELVGTAWLSGSATEGPATGTSRVALYNEVLDCVRDTHCATGLAFDCYCGSASGPQCDAGNGNGACRSVIERGLETTSPSQIAAHFTDLTLGGGLALARVSCDQNNCPLCL
jgi:hypothetical protein